MKSEKFVVVVTERYEFTSRAEAEACADFKQYSELDNPACTQIEVEKKYGPDLTNERKPV